jgi:hypothetical protein
MWLIQLSFSKTSEKSLEIIKKIIFVSYSENNPPIFSHKKTLNTMEKIFGIIEIYLIASPYLFMEL